MIPSPLLFSFLTQTARPAPTRADSATKAQHIEKKKTDIAISKPNATRHPRHAAQVSDSQATDIRPDTTHQRPPPPICPGASADTDTRTPAYGRSRPPTPLLPTAHVRHGKPSTIRPASVAFAPTLRPLSQHKNQRIEKHAALFRVNLLANRKIALPLHRFNNGACIPTKPERW